jgi:hypothetical protein
MILLDRLYSFSPRHCFASVHPTSKKAYVEFG